MKIVLRRAARTRVSALAAALTALALVAVLPAGAAGTAVIAGGASAPDTAQKPSTTASTSTIVTAAANAPSSITTAPANTARQHAKGGSELSSGAILAAVLAGLIALACLVWAAFRWLAVEPRWTLPLRHSIAEAGFRASAVWAEFTDWIRLGH